MLPTAADALRLRSRFGKFRESSEHRWASSRKLSVSLVRTRERRRFRKCNDWLPWLKVRPSSLPFSKPCLLTSRKPYVERYSRNVLYKFQEKASSVGAILTSRVSTLTFVYEVLSFRSTLCAPLLARAASVLESLHNTEEQPGTKYVCPNH